MFFKSTNKPWIAIAIIFALLLGMVPLFLSSPSGGSSFGQTIDPSSVGAGVGGTGVGVAADGAVVGAVVSGVGVGVAAGACDIGVTAGTSHPTKNNTTNVTPAIT